MTALAGAAVLGGAGLPGRPAAGAPPAPTGADAEAHRPVVTVPRSAIGSLVPVFVSVPLPVTADHYIRTLEIAVPTDPIPS